MNYSKLSLTLIALFAMTAQAQVNRDGFVGGLGGTLRQGIEQQLPEPNFLPLPEAKAPKQPAPEAKPDAVKVTVKGFRFTGVTLLPEQELKDALANWLGKSWSLEELQQVNEIIADKYQQKGYLVQSNLPPQKIGNDGMILIGVLEAKFGGVNLDVDKDSRMSGEIAKRFILSQNKVGDFLRTDKVERSVYILKEVPGIAVATEIEPGQKDGEANLKLKLENGQLIAGRFETNNYGSRTTGQLQYTSFVQINNPLGFGEQITLNGLASEGSQYGQVGFSVPVGYSGWRAGATASYMDYRTIGIFAGSAGRSQTLGASLTYPLLRSQSTNANLAFNLDKKTYLNADSTTDAVKSSYIITNYSATLSGNHYDGYFGGGVSSGSMTFTTGNLSFNTDSPSNYGVNTPQQFNKLNFSLSRNQQIVPDQTVLNITFSGQLADSNLDSAERFYLGGAYGIKAYPSAQGGGSQGVSLSLELQQQFPNRVVGSFFVDAGRIQQYVKPYDGWQGSTNADNEYNLFGFGFGAKWTYEKATFSGSTSWRVGNNPLFSYTGEQVNTDGRYYDWYVPYVWLQVQYPFN